MNNLTRLMLETGLIQFGWFDESQVPFRLSFELLPSYPDVLDEVVNSAIPLVGKVDHLLSAPSAVPFGVGLSLKLGLPLVYSRGLGEAPVYDLVGAYDIGHPALMIANSIVNNTELISLAAQARQVGLEIDRVLVIMDEQVSYPDGLDVISLLNLKTVVSDLIENGMLPPGHGQAVFEWINRHQD